MTNIMEPFTLASLPETDAVARTLRKIDDDRMKETLSDLLVWCLLRDEERAVLTERNAEATAKFAAAWADVPEVFTSGDAEYRKWATYWTVDGAGFLGQPGRITDEAAREAWEKVRPKGATVTVVGGQS